MTTRKELGEMLITGKPMQEMRTDEGVYEDMPENDAWFDTSCCTYRLKPTITYYRVFLNYEHRVEVESSSDKFPPFSDWTRGNSTYIHDFQIEE